MASERQLAANRRNARRSRGPRSVAGKKRASLNSLRHGLAATSEYERADSIEKLARQIAGNTSDPKTLELARSIAYAEFDLAQIRRVKVALISTAMRFGRIESPLTFKTFRQAKQLYDAIRFGDLIVPELSPEAPEAAATARSVEAVRLVLPELFKFDRYERRAAARRNRALRLILAFATGARTI